MATTTSSNGATATCQNDGPPLKKSAKIDGSISIEIAKFDVKKMPEIVEKDEATHSSSLTPADCPYKIRAIRPIFHGRWMGAKQVDFTCPRTKSDGIWQVGYRSSKLKDADVDGVFIIPYIKYKDGTKKFVIIRQYRIPVMAWCLEFPAGLLDPNETIEQCAIRELKEETGYTAHKVVKMSKKLALDPGLVDATAKMVMLEIDGDDSINKNPEQSLCEGEHIEQFSIGHDQLLKFVENKSNEGLCIEAALYSFACAYDMALNIATL